MQSLLNQAVRILDGEKAYNNANLDQYLMGIKQIKCQIKQIKTKYPEVRNSATLRNKLSKADETFYQQYAVRNDNIKSS